MDSDIFLFVSFLSENTVHSCKNSIYLLICRASRRIVIGAYLKFLCLEKFIKHRVTIPCKWSFDFT